MMLIDELGRVYEEHKGKLLSIPFRFGLVDESEDIIQEAFFKAIRGIGGFRKGASLKTWITSIVVNQCLEVIRKGKIGANNGEQFDDMVSGEMGTLEVLVEREREKELRGKVGRLKDKEREVIIRYYWGEAKNLGNTEKTNKFRGIKKLRGMRWGI